MQVVEKTTANNRKKGKGIKWGQNHPLWKLLHDKIKSGNVPLNTGEMGPTIVQEICGDSLEFYVDEMDFDAFVWQLQNVRQTIEEEEPLFPWNESDPAP